MDTGVQIEAMTDGKIKGRPSVWGYHIVFLDEYRPPNDRGVESVLRDLPMISMAQPPSAILPAESLTRLLELLQYDNFIP